MSLAYSDKKFEKSNQRKALVITLAINSLLFLLIWQVKIWNDSPNPPAIPVQDAGIGEISFEQESPAPAPAPQKQELTQSTADAVQTTSTPALTSTVASPVTVKAQPPVPVEPKEIEEPVDLTLTLGKRSPKAGSASGAGGGTGTGAGSGKGLGTGLGGGGRGSGNGSGQGEGKIAQDWTFDTKALNGIENGSETGEITFFIRINERGNVTEIRIDRTNVKLSLAERYKKLIKNSRFYPRSEGISRGASGFKTIKIVPTN
jgi:hypothetical protein